MIEIRTATVADLDSIVTLHAESWRTFYKGIWTDAFLDNDVYQDRLTVWQQRLHFPPSNQHVFLAIENGSLIGFSCLYIDDDPIYGSLLDNLHVIANRQGTGLGKQLIKICAVACLQYSKNEKLYLWALQENYKARKFYENLGAINIEIVAEQHPDGSISNGCRYIWKDVTKLLQCA